MILTRDEIEALKIVDPRFAGLHIEKVNRKVLHELCDLALRCLDVEAQLEKVTAERNIYAEMVDAIKQVHEEDRAQLEKAEGILRSVASADFKDCPFAVQGCVEMVQSCGDCYENRARAYFAAKGKGVQR